MTPPKGSQFATRTSVRDRLRSAESRAEYAEARIEKAMGVIGRYGGTDGGHHKAWVIDQAARALMDSGYEAWVLAMKAGDDGPETYDWDEGIAP